MQGDSHRVASALTAKIQLSHYGMRPTRGVMKSMERRSKRHAKADHLWCKQDTPELSFALVDKDRNIMKFSMMTYVDSFKRNRVMKGFGFAWVRCDRRNK